MKTFKKLLITCIVLLGLLGNTSSSSQGAKVNQLKVNPFYVAKVQAPEYRVGLAEQALNLVISDIGVTISEIEYLNSKH